MVLRFVDYFMAEYGRLYMTRPNPFRPTFGSLPHILAGRDDVPDRIAAVFALVEGDPDAHDGGDRASWHGQDGVVEQGSAGRPRA